MKMRLFLAIMAVTAAFLIVGLQVSSAEQAIIELDAATEQFISELELTSPDIIEKARRLLQHRSKIGSSEVWTIVKSMMSDTRPEARRAAADMLASDNHVVRLFVMRQLGAAGTETEYFLNTIVAWWDDIAVKEKVTLSGTLPRIVRANTDNPTIMAYANEIAGLMIAHSGKQVPLAGISLAKQLEMTGDEVIVALEKQRNNEIYDYFDNEHPVRKAVLDLLGEEYTPPEREEIDFAAISVAEQEGLKRSSGLTVGVLTSLYTATGPCYGGGDGYGWSGQCKMLRVLTDHNINVLAYCHPITEGNNLPVTSEMAQAGVKMPLLNSASVADLRLCDVLVLAGVCNLRKEVVAALEDYVWNGGGLITIDATGVISCLDGERFAALQDMKNLRWSWTERVNEVLLPHKDSPLTEGLDLSLVLQSLEDLKFYKNGYTLTDAVYDDQVLLRFKKIGTAALRISSYGSGRVAHFAWPLWFGKNEVGRRDWQLFDNVQQWAAAQKFTNVCPKSVVSKQRHPSVKKTIKDTPRDPVIRPAE